MKGLPNLSLLVLLALLPLDLLRAAEPPPWSRAYDPARDPFADGREAIALAQATGRRVLIELGGDWCVWCHRLDRFLERNPEVGAALERRFVLLKVNVSEENGNDEFLAGLPRVAGYPHLFVADGDGTVIHSQDMGELVEGGRYSAERFLAFVERWGGMDHAAR